jgi:hypothetical protein
MCIHHLLRVLIVLLLSSLIPAPLAAADQTFDTQEIAISDSRTGAGPCGFKVQRNLEGTVSVTPGIDDEGHLVLMINEVQMVGTLTNPSNGKSTDIRWVHQNDYVSIVADGTTTEVVLGLDGTLSRGYDSGRSSLQMGLPLDGADLVEFAAGERADDPWSHVCGLLAD